MLKNLLYLFVALTFVQNAWAGWVVTYKDEESGARSQELYDHGKYRGEGAIYDRKNIIAFDRKSRAYWKGTMRQFCTALGEMKKKMNVQMEAAYAEHPEYRSVPAKKEKFTRKSLGNKKIAGYLASGYVFFNESGINYGRLWVSFDATLRALEKESGEGASKQMETCFKGQPSEGDGLHDSAIYQQTVKDGFILKEPHREVVSVEKKRLSADSFNPPEGFRAFHDYQKFMDYSLNTPRSSSRSPLTGEDISQKQVDREERYDKSDEGMNEQNDSEPEKAPDLNELKEGAREIFESFF